MSAALLLGPAACLGSAAFWALAANVYTRAARVSSPTAVNFARASISFPFFLLGALALDPSGLALVGPGRAGWLVLSVVGSYVLGDALFLSSARLLGVPVALAVSSVYPLWSALAGALFLGQRIAPAGYAGVVLVVAGVVTVVGKRKTGAETGGAPGETPGSRPAVRTGSAAGVLLALATSFLWALNTFAIARGGADLHVAVVNTYRMGFAAALIPLGTLLLRRRARTLVLPAGELRRAWPYLLLESVGGTALFVFGLTRSPLAVAAALTSLAPVLSVPFALAIGRERLGARVLAGIFIVTAGIVLLVAFGQG